MQNFHVPNTWKNPFGALSGCQPVVLATEKLQVHSDLCDGFVRTLETCKARMCSFNSLVGMHEFDSIGEFVECSLNLLIGILYGRTLQVAKTMLKREHKF